MITKHFQEVKQESDVRKIEHLMREIANEKCWGTCLSYGNELCIEIGAKSSHPVLASKEEGSWTLGTRASEWFLYVSNNLLVASSSDLDLIKQKILLIDENRISAFGVEYPRLGLEIVFSNEMKLKIQPNWFEDSQLAHWELFMPNHMLLQVGPKSTWSYYRSDLPVSKLSDC